MAVSKIRKISSWTLLSLIVVSIGVCLAFFLGGVERDMAGNKVYAMTDLMLNWTYVLVVATLGVTLCFAVWALIQGFRANPKKTLRSLVLFILLVALLIVTYMLGDGAAMKVNEDSAQFNTPGWLKTIDMCLYSAYVLVVCILASIVWGAFTKKVSK